MMKTIALLCLFLLAHTAQADEVSLSVCRYPGDAYQFSFTGDVDGWWFNNFISADLVTLVAVGSGTEFVVYYDGSTESIFADPAAPLCHDESDTWKPGAPSIPIELHSDCAFVEIQDAYGHWSQVTSDGKPVLLHYGQALIGSINQSTDPADYRAVETECYA